MGLFGFKNSGGPERAERVLAYLVDAQRQMAPLKIEDAQGCEVPATLELVTHKRVMLTSQAALGLGKGSDTHLVFILDGLRFKAPTRVLEVDSSGALTLELPEAVHLAERRKMARGYLNAREGAAAMAMAGLFSPLAAGALAALGPSPALIGGAGVRVMPDGSPGGPHQPAPDPVMARPPQAMGGNPPWMKTNLSLDSTFRTSYVANWLEARHITLNGPSVPALEHGVNNACFEYMIHANQPYVGPLTDQNSLARRLGSRSLSCGFTYTFMSRPLPERWRRVFLMSSVKLEAYVAGNNLRLGLRIK